MAGWFRRLPRRQDAHSRIAGPYFFLAMAAGRFAVREFVVDHTLTGRLPAGNDGRHERADRTFIDRPFWRARMGERAGRCPAPAPRGLVVAAVFGSMRRSTLLGITPVPWLGWHDWLTWAQMITVFWVVLNGVRSPAARTMLFGALFILGAVAAGMAGYQHFVKPDWMMLGRIQTWQFIGRASGPFGIPNSLGAFLLLLIPPAGFLACQRRRTRTGRRILSFGSLTLFFAVGLVLTIQSRRVAWLGARAGGVAAVSPGVGIGAGASHGAALVLGLPVALGLRHSTPPSRKCASACLYLGAGCRGEKPPHHLAWSHQHIFRDHPTWGGGAGGDSIRSFEKYRPGIFSRPAAMGAQRLPSTPFCDYGLVGFLLFVAAGAAIVWRSWRGSRKVEVTAATGSRVNAVGISTGARDRADRFLAPAVCGVSFQDSSAGDELRHNCGSVGAARLDEIRFNWRRRKTGAPAKLGDRWRGGGNHDAFCFATLSGGGRSLRSPPAN